MLRYVKVEQRGKERDYIIVLQRYQILSWNSRSKGKEKVSYSTSLLDLVAKL